MRQIGTVTKTDKEKIDKESIHDAVLIVRHADDRLGAKDITRALSMLKGDGSDILPVVYTFINKKAHCVSGGMNCLSFDAPMAATKQSTVLFSQNQTITIAVVSYI